LDCGFRALEAIGDCNIKVGTKKSIFGLGPGGALGHGGNCNSTELARLLRYRTIDHVTAVAALQGIVLIMPLVSMCIDPSDQLVVVQHHLCVAGLVRCVSLQVVCELLHLVRFVAGFRRGVFEIVTHVRDMARVEAPANQHHGENRQRNQVIAQPMDPRMVRHDLQNPRKDPVAIAKRLERRDGQLVL
jgi:hypothetical protein